MFLLHLNRITRVCIINVHVPEDLHTTLRLHLIPESDCRPRHGFCTTGQDKCACSHHPEAAYLDAAVDLAVEVDAWEFLLLPERPVNKAGRLTILAIVDENK
jgi:hypothetical protein